ncbi:MAG: hypothetical protein SFX19_07685 [Alphaproteobacteria bacterium]|nr:hypothetical protein [Alphaproteobacteria bacterium]
MVNRVFPSGQSPEDVDNYVRALLPSITSPAVSFETFGGNTRLDENLLAEGDTPATTPIAKAKQNEIEFIRLAMRDTLTGQTDASDELNDCGLRLIYAYQAAGIENHGDAARRFIDHVLEQAERLVRPRQAEDIAALMPVDKPDAAEVAARRETAKILQDITGLAVEIVPRDDYRRQWYQFTVKPKDHGRKLTDEPLIVGQLHDYIANIIRDSGVQNVHLQMSSKDDWYSSVKLHFGGGGGFSLPSADALQEARQFKSAIERFASGKGRGGLAAYQQETLTTADFMDGGQKIQVN